MQAFARGAEHQRRDPLVAEQGGVGPERDAGAGRGTAKAGVGGLFEGDGDGRTARVHQRIAADLAGEAGAEIGDARGEVRQYPSQIMLHRIGRFAVYRAALQLHGTGGGIARHFLPAPDHRGVDGAWPQQRRAGPAFEAITIGFECHEKMAGLGDGVDAQIRP